MYTLEGKTMLAQRLATILLPESAGRKEKEDRRLFQQALIVPKFIDVQTYLAHRNLLESQGKGR